MCIRDRYAVVASSSQVHLAEVRPVSYTHLDVYKRQAVDCAAPGGRQVKACHCWPPTETSTLTPSASACSAPARAAAWTASRSTEAVSYTHLDVYKRQVYVAPGVEPLVSLREPRTYTVRSSAVGVVAVVTLRLVAVERTTETAPERVAPPAMWTTARRAAAGAAGRVTVTVPDPGEAGTVAQNRWTASLLAVAGAAVTTCQDPVSYTHLDVYKRQR